MPDGDATPWNSSLATQDGGRVRGLNLDTEYASAIMPGLSVNNVRLSSEQTLSGDATVNALVAQNDGAVTIANDARLTITSGALVLAGGARQSNSTVSMLAGGTAASSNPMFVFTESPDATGRFEIASSVETPSLVKSGNATLILSHSNAIPGGITINSGTLASIAAGALGSGTVTLRGGQLAIEGVSQTIGGAGGLRLSGSALQQTTNSLSTVGGGISYIRIDPGLTATVSGPVSGLGTVNVYGDGTIRLTGDLQSDALASSMNFFGGAIEVVGTFDVNDQFGTRFWLNGNGLATLRGNATIGARTTLFDIDPSSATSAIGRLSFTHLTEVTGNEIVFDIASSGAAGTAYDQVVLGGNSFLLRPSLKVRLDDGFVPVIGSRFTIVDALVADIGTFDGLAEGAVFEAGGANFQITYHGGNDGNDVVLTTVVPEPSYIALPTAIAFVMSRRARRRSSNVSAFSER